MKHKDAEEPIAIDTETTSLNPFKAELVGLGFCFGKSLKDIVYISKIIIKYIEINFQ